MALTFTPPLLEDVEPELGSVVGMKNVDNTAGCRDDMALTCLGRSVVLTDINCLQRLCLEFCLRSFALLLFG